MKPERTMPTRRSMRWIAVSLAMACGPGLMPPAAAHAQHEHPASPGQAGAMAR